MQHGRSHDERQCKAPHPRSNNVPVDEDTLLETELIPTGRHGATVPAESAGHGSECAPTKQAEARERERHRLEREIGRVAAGEADGLPHDVRAPGLTRDRIDEAAREADRRIIGREVATRAKP